MRRVFNKDKDVYLLIGKNLVVFRKDSKGKEESAVESARWIYELFLATVQALKKTKKLFEKEEEHKVFMQECIKKLTEAAHDDR